MEQLSLFPDWHARARTADRLRDVVFYAVLCTAALDRSPAPLLADLRRHHGLTGRSRPSRTLHVSILRLALFERLTRDDLAILREAAAAITLKPFDLDFPYVESLGREKQAGQRPLVLHCGEGAAELIALGRDLEHALFRRGFCPEGQPPTLPHLTLLYDDRRVPRTPVAPPLHMRVNGFALIHSHRGEGRYSVLWPG